MSIALVIGSHVLYGFHVVPAANIGDLGVRIFFVISGFLITGILAKEMGKTGSIDLLRFYYRRTLRIFPPYYFLLGLLAVLAVLGKVAVTGYQLLPALSYTSDYIFPGAWDLDHAWSLSVEEQFYLLFPGVLLLAGRRKSIWLLAATLVLCPLVRKVDYHFFVSSAPIWLTKGFQSNLDTFAVGCLLAMLREKLHAIGLYRRFLASPAVLLVPIVVFVINAQIDYAGLDLGLSYSFENILMAVMIDRAVTHSGGLVGRALNTRGMVFVGMMSYSIYLWQQPFLDPQPTSAIFRFPFNVIGFVAMVAISYFIVERYSLLVRQRCEKYLFTRIGRPTLSKTPA